MIPRLRIAANKVGFDFDKDFTVTDNTCPAIAGGDALVLREKFAGKILLNTEESVRAQAIRLRGNALNSVKAQKVFFSNEGDAAQKAFDNLSDSLQQFEKERAAAGKQ